MLHQNSSVYTVEQKGWVCFLFWGFILIFIKKMQNIWAKRAKVKEGVENMLQEEIQMEGCV